MASHLVGQRPVSTFVTPVAGTSPIDANVVRSQDNTNGSTYTGHDADATIHVQDSILGSRSAAATAGRKWLTTDAGAFYLFYDDGAAWNEISYLRSSGGALSGALAITSASANALAVGLNGATNPAFNVDSSTALQVAGLNVIGAVTGGTVAVAVTDSGLNASLTINAKGTGTIGIGSVSTGRVTITPVTTITGVLTLTAQPILSSLTASQAVFTDGSKGLVSNAITGTGNVVMSASPTLSGTVGGALTFSGALTLSSALTYGGVTLSNAVTGTGNMVLSASPTLTGTLTSGAITASGTLTINAAAAQTILTSTTGTNPVDHVLISTGGTYHFGVENSAGGVFGATAYAQVIFAAASRNIEFFPGAAKALTLTSAGAATFAGAVSGITTLSGSGAVSGFTSISMNGALSGTTTFGLSGLQTWTNVAATDTKFLTSLTTTTGANYFTFINTGGTYQVGADNSAGTQFGTAYDLFIDAPATRGISLFIAGTGTIARATATGLAVTGGISATTGTLTAAAPTVAAAQVGYGSTTQTTIGANGAASALTANPVGYLIINVAGNNRIVPYYNP